MKDLFLNIFGSKIIRILIIVLISIGIIYFLFELLVQIYSIKNFEKNDQLSLIASFRDIIQTIFFITIIILTILSYLQARKTLFTPIKTEIFKLQIKEFEKLLAIFQNKSETDFLVLFDFEGIFINNARLMAVDFVHKFFKNVRLITPDELNILRTNFAGYEVSKKYAEKFFRPIDLKNIVGTSSINTESSEKWEDYEYGQIGFTKKYAEEIKRLHDLIASPLLREELKSLLRTFSDKVKKNLMMVGEFLTNKSKELPKLFPDLKSFAKMDLRGMWNEYMHSYTNLEEESKKILEYVNKYFKVSELMK